jgi:hypothetical protein
MTQLMHTRPRYIGIATFFVKKIFNHVAIFATDFGNLNAASDN